MLELVFRKYIIIINIKLILFIISTVAKVFLVKLELKLKL